MEEFIAVKRNLLVIFTALLAAVVMVFISESAYWRSLASLNELDTMATSRREIRRLELGMRDVEVEQQKYLLSGRQDDFGAYKQGIQTVRKAIEALSLRYAPRPQAATVLAQLSALTDAHLSAFANKIIWYEDGRQADHPDPTFTSVGFERTEDIRTLISQLLDEDAQGAIEERRAVYRTLTFSRIGVTLLSVISLMALVMYLRQSYALAREQRRQSSLLLAQRDQLECDMSESTAQLVELTHHLQSAREDERSRLARDLHDELGSLLTSAKLDAARIKSRLADTAPEASERLEHLVSTLNSGIALKRRIAEDLRPSSLSQLGLTITLEILAREYEKSSGVRVLCDLKPVKLSPSAELVVYRMMQEAITNITKYAQAKHVWLSTAEGANGVTVRVRDDGVGMDTTVPPKSAYGLLGMHYRVKAQGGSFKVTSSPGQGTLIEARFALSDTPRE